MNFKAILILMIIWSQLSCQDKKQIPKYNFPEKTIYSIEEINEECHENIIDASKTLFNLFETSALDVFGNVDPKIASKISDAIYNEYKDSIISHPYKMKIESMIQKMKPFMVHKKDFSVYIVKTKVQNAMIAPGQKIFITTGFIDFIKNDEELAVVLGHELGHMENGHLDKIIKRYEASQNLGPFSEIAGNIGSIIAAPFGSVDEHICDRTGLYLAYKSGFDPMIGIEFIKRLSEKENANDALNRFFRTHPYSIDRYYCSKNYLNQIKEK